MEIVSLSNKTIANFSQSSKSPVFDNFNNISSMHLFGPLQRVYGQKSF